MPVVVQDRCPQDHRCPLLDACPVGAIDQESFNAPSIDDDVCIECGICTRSCPYGAMTEKTVNETVKPHSAGTGL